MIGSHEEECQGSRASRLILNRSSIRYYIQCLGDY